MDEPSKVIHLDFNKKEGPFLNGKERCLNCYHQWQAVIEAGTYDFKCPNCEADKGYLLGAIMFENGMEFVCECGIGLFKIGTKSQVVCSHCGSVKGYIDFLNDDNNY